MHKDLLVAQTCDRIFEGVPCGVVVEGTTNIWNIQGFEQKKSKFLRNFLRMSEKSSTFAPDFIEEL